MIRNLRTGKVISRKELYCNGPLSLAMGLRFRRPQVAVLSLPSLQQAGLDMLFVFFVIDVLFLDGQKRVIEIKKGLRPWRGYTPRKPWRYAIEIPHLKGSKARLGDQLKF